MGAFGAYARRYACVDTVAGSNAGTGSIGSPVASLAEALARLATTGGTVFVRAPSSSPLTTAVTVRSFLPITIRPWDDEPWHLSTSSNVAITHLGHGELTIIGGHLTGDGYAVRHGSDDFEVHGPLVVEDTYGRGGQSGFQTLGAFADASFTRCEGLGVANDGFNLHGTGEVEMIDCIGSDCGDEGVSPHGNVVLTIVGGEFRRNAQSGMAAVGDSVCHISGGAVFDGNGHGGSSWGGIPYGGVTLIENSSGSIDDLTATNNVGPGVRVDTTGSVTLGTWVSEGNGVPDILP